MNPVVPGKQNKEKQNQADDKQMMNKFWKKILQTIFTVVIFLFMVLMLIHSFHYFRNKDVTKPPHGYPSLDIIKLAGFLGIEKLVNLKPAVPADIIEYRDIEYKKIGDRSLTLDIYRAKNLSDAAPALIFIHGGAWKGGDKQDYLVYLIDFARRGFVTASVSYRFSQEALFPAAVKDVKCAVKWLKFHSKDFFINPEKVAVIGGSAGGYLALMIAYSLNESFFAGECSTDSVNSKVQAVVNLYGPVDLTTDFAVSNSAVINFLGGKYEEFPDRYKIASPGNFISPENPPTLIFHGTIDEIVPISQSDSLKKWLENAGVTNTYFRLSGWPHTMDAVVSVNKFVQHHMAEFFEMYLGR